MKKILLKIVAFGLLIFAVFLVFNIVKTGSSERDASDKVDNQNTSQTFDKSHYSNSEPSSLWVVVNKARKLPANFEPANLRAPGANTPLANYSRLVLRSDAEAALDSMFDQAKRDDIDLALISGYRSYQEQEQVYQQNVATYGQPEADKTSARPGHSEHQTGLAADVGRLDDTCRLNICFGDTNEGKWLANNAYKFGFILRYKKGAEKIVGFSYEPWHIRFVGKDLALQIKKNNTTLEQFFGLPPAPNYK